MDGIVWHHDNETFPGGRFIGPTGKDRAYTRTLANGRVLHGFSVALGDTSENDRAAYAHNPAQCPQRAMRVWEGLAPVAMGEPIRREYVFNLLALPQASAGRVYAKALWTVLAQLNTPPITAPPVWRSPPLEIGIKPVKGVDHLHFALRRLNPDAPAGNGILAAEALVEPIDRTKDYKRRVAYEYTRTAPGEGSARMWLEDRLILDYAGPLGYPDHGAPFPAVGVYRNGGTTEPISVMFEDNGFTA